MSGGLHHGDCNSASRWVVSSGGGSLWLAPHVGVASWQSRVCVAGSMLIESTAGS